MRKTLYMLAIAGWLLTGTLSALHVKVLQVDYGNRTATILLPVHHATVEVELAPDEPEIEVRADEFYEAQLQPGKVNTVRRNWLHIKVRPKKSVRFRLRKVTFHD